MCPTIESPRAKLTKRCVGAIFVAANFCLWPVIGSAFTQTWVQLLICRLLLGVGMGAKASTGKFLCNPSMILEPI